MTREGTSKLRRAAPTALAVIAGFAGAYAIATSIARDEPPEVPEAESDGTVTRIAGLPSPETLKHGQFPALVVPPPPEPKPRPGGPPPVPVDEAPTTSTLTNTAPAAAPEPQPAPVPVEPAPAPPTPAPEPAEPTVEFDDSG